MKKKTHHRHAKGGRRSHFSCSSSNNAQVVKVKAVMTDCNEKNEDDSEQSETLRTKTYVSGSDSSMRMDFYPFAYALNDDQLAQRCWYCLAKMEPLRRCRSCHKGLFCNHKCQSLGWKDHRLECKAIKCRDTVPGVEVRLLGRIITRYKAIKLGRDKEDSDFYTDRMSRRSIMEIWSHTDIMKNDRYAMKKFSDIYGELVAFYGSKALVTKDEVFELHCRNYINRHAISDSQYCEEIGKGLYLDLCAYDHSCRPNTVYTCNGFVATLRSITVGVDLTDLSSTHYSYIDLINTKQYRRKLLKDTWYFNCQCERCIDPRDDILSAIICPNCEEEREVLCVFGDLPYKDKETQIITCPKCHNKVPQEYVVEAISAMRFIDQIIDNREVEQMPNTQAVEFLVDLMKRFSKMLPNVNVYLYKIVQVLTSLISPSDYPLLLDLHLKMEDCLRICFAYNHPAVAVHYRSTATCFLKCKQPHRAMLYYKKADEIFKFTLGTEHPLTIETEAMLRDAVQEVEKAKELILGANRSSSFTNISNSESGVSNSNDVMKNVVVVE